MTTVEICEVSPRDGLQNESTVLSTIDKVELVERAVRAGARRIEVTSFVNPKRVPQMADAAEVMALLPRVESVRYAGLVMNERGLERALGTPLDEINVVVVATDTFCQRNQGVTTKESVKVATSLITQARRAGLFTTVTIGASFGCPFEGEVSMDRLGAIIEDVLGAEPDELCLADTIGVAAPRDITERTTLARTLASDTPLRLHLHDTRHTGVANAVAGVAAGVGVLDASIGGTGGCPFAPGATGNVATEDLAYLFARSGVATGLDLAQLVDATAWLEGKLAKQLPGSILRAGDFASGSKDRSAQQYMEGGKI
jgi:hydroxymethylglutaryl-CoA lyase